MKRVDGYAPIQDYALIGDGRACALVAGDGSIDWLAVPRVDSETVFARLLDAGRGGAFELAPGLDFRVEREYVGDSNVLRTTFVTARGTVRVTDAITLDNGAFLPWFELVRGIEGVSGTVPMRWRITPRFGAGEGPKKTTIERLGTAVLATSRPAMLAVYPFDAGEPHHTDDEITGALELGTGERASLVLQATHDEPIPVARRDWAERRVVDTARDWERRLAAAGQLQLGCYGDLFETADLYVREGNALDEHTAARLADILDHLTTIWTREDSGIWELPDKQHYTLSKIAVWTAFDRALRLVERGQLPRERAERWRESAKQVRAFVEGECWSEPRGCYTMFPGSASLDASILRVSRMGFLDLTDERFSRIIDSIRDELDAGGGLLYRYSGQQRVEGAFVACSFWVVEALARAGRIDAACRTMREALAHANDVGLFSEEIDPETGAFLGNFPQGLSHLALVNSAA